MACTKRQPLTLEIAGFSVSGVADLHQIYTNSALNRQKKPPPTNVSGGFYKRSQKYAGREQVLSADVYLYVSFF